MNTHLNNIFDGYVSNGLWALTIFVSIMVVHYFKKNNFSERYRDTFSKKNDNRSLLNTFEVSDNIFFSDLITNHKIMRNSRW
jgi:hypothetical protein